MKPFSENIILVLVLTLLICLNNNAYAAPVYPDLAEVVVTPISPCKIKVTTTLLPASTYQTNEKSIGFFYRLDAISSEQAYYWDTILLSTNTVLEKIIELPNDSFEITCYQVRKGGPIRTGKTVRFAISGSTCTNTFPKYNLTSSALFMDASWNVFTESGYTDVTQLHHTTNTSATPTSSAPWLFLAVSLKNTGMSGTILFDDAFFNYAGAIYDNNKDNWISSGLSDTYILNSGSISINSLIVPNSTENNFLLIFEVDPAHPAQETVNFTANLGVSSSSLTLGVHGKPHDPNYLAVDNPLICPCRDEEYLTYHVNFQNKGNAPAKDVKVRLLLDASDYLIASTIEVQKNGNSLPNTFLRNTKVDNSALPKHFIIEDIYLPGSNEKMPGTNQVYPYAQTEDFFKFKVRKVDCLPKGTKIEPQAEIIFFDTSGSPMDTIFTNLELTLLDSRENCAPSLNCQGRCKKKKPCWLFSIFRPRNRNKN